MEVYDSSSSLNVRLPSFSSLSTSSSGSRRKRNDDDGFMWRKAQRLNTSRSSQTIQLKSTGIYRKTRSNDRVELRKVKSTHLRRPSRRTNDKNLSSSNKNEDWDDAHVAKASCMKVTRPATQANVLLKFISSKGDNKVKKDVTFAETPPVVHASICSPDGHDAWYKSSDDVQFAKDAEDAAAKIQSVMKWAAKVEDTYKPSIGLPSPSVLGDYLSTPQGVVGVELSLDGQSMSRSTLVRTHKKSLFAEQARQREAGKPDAEELAKILMNTSDILSDMARERAEYVAKLD